MVWRSPKKQFDPQCIVPRVKQWWRCLTRRRIEKLHILDRTISYRESFIYDNDSKHTSVLVKDRLVKQHMKTLSWSSYSPDLNPAERLWDELERRLKKHQPKNRQELGKSEAKLAQHG